MKLFTDVKIGRRLAIGFGIILGLMVVMVITEVVYLSAQSGGWGTLTLYPANGRIGVGGRSVPVPDAAE